MSDARFGKLRHSGLARRAVSTLVVAFLQLGIASTHAGSGVSLREALGPGVCTQAQVELKAEGLFRPALPHGVTSEAKMPRPLAIDVKTRLVFLERLLEIGYDARGSGNQANEKPAATGKSRSRAKSVRFVIQAASAINGEVRPTAGALRPELGLMVAEKGGGSDQVVVVSPGGPLTRAELELVEGLGDPLVLPDLLPPKPIEKRAKWTLPVSTVQSLTGYDTIKSGKLEATLEGCDDRSARMAIKGEVQGSVLGGGGSIDMEGFATFDREAGLIDRLELNRTEKRDAGPVEAGLEVKSTLTVVRRIAKIPPELSDRALADLPLDTTAPRQLLQWISPDKKFNLLHDRLWHTYWDDTKLTVLKRVQNGQVVAQCNLAAGPRAGKGRHQDLAQFRDDIRRSLKDRFVQFLGAGEVEGDPAGGFRYKVGVQGREGDLGVRWYYFLLASPDGDQVLATFTLAEQDAKAFGNQDLEMIGSLQWSRAGTDRDPSSAR
jgi:hypothetical protein